MENQEKAERTEGAVLAALFKAGKAVLKPFGYNQRYDLVIEENGTFKRIQCKTGRIRSGSLRFNVYSVCKETKQRKYYHGQVEYFGVYCIEIDKVYLIPIADVEHLTAEVYLRIDPPKTNNGKKFKYAKDYEI